MIIKQDRNALLKDVQLERENNKELNAELEDVSNRQQFIPGIYFLIPDVLTNSCG